MRESRLHTRKGCYTLTLMIYIILIRNEKAISFLKWLECLRRKMCSSSLTYSFPIFNRILFPTTLTELNAMAAPATIGSSKNPLTGYKTPAAKGIPIRL